MIKMSHTLQIKDSLMFGKTENIAKLQPQQSAAATL